MSLNHIIQSSVPDDEALDVKFNNVEVLGTITGGYFPTTIFNMAVGRKIDAEETTYSPFFVDLNAIGSRTIPANTLKVGSMIDIDVRGQMFNELPGAITVSVVFSIGSQLIEVNDIPFNQIIGEQQFSCKVKVHIRNPNVLTLYFDWDSPNASSVISVKSASVTTAPMPIDFTIDNDVSIDGKINGIVSSNVYLYSSFGTITIQ
jgi:hypothetical protein